MSMELVVDVVERHAEEAAFLWTLRDAATDQPHYNLELLRRLEERIDAHLDGLRVAGEAAHEIVWNNLQQSPGAGELFTVSVAAIESGDRIRIERVLEFAASIPQSRRGLFGALGWVEAETLRGEVAAWLQAPAAFRRLAGVVACSLHRADPGVRLARLLDDEPAIRARALRLAGELGRVDLREDLVAFVDNDDLLCRFWAAWSTGLLGDRAESIPRLERYTTADDAIRWRALDLLLRLMDPDDGVRWLRQLGQDPSQQRVVVTGVGILGNPTVLPWLITKMRVPTLARVAGESFRMITGVDLSASKLDGNAIEAASTGPTDDPADENVAMDPDENLPWPDADKVEAWWLSEGSRFPRSGRLLSGLPFGREACIRVWQDGYQRQRRAAAYELALMSPGRHLRNWRARSTVQTRWLQSAEC